MSKYYTKVYIKSDCPICMETCDYFYAFICGHPICGTCIDKIKKDTCPTCNLQIDDENPFEECGECEPFEQCEQCDEFESNNKKLYKKLKINKNKIKITDMFVISKYSQSYDSYDRGQYLVFEYIENNKKKYFSFLEDSVYRSFMMGLYAFSNRESRCAITHDCGCDGCIKWHDFANEEFGNYEFDNFSEEDSEEDTNDE